MYRADQRVEAFEGRPLPAQLAAHLQAQSEVARLGPCQCSAAELQAVGGHGGLGDGLLVPPASPDRADQRRAPARWWSRLAVHRRLCSIHGHRRCRAGTFQPAHAGVDLRPASSAICHRTAVALARRHPPPRRRLPAQQTEAAAASQSSIASVRVGARQRPTTPDVDGVHASHAGQLLACCGTYAPGRFVPRRSDAGLPDRRADVAAQLQRRQACQPTRRPTPDEPPGVACPGPRGCGWCRRLLKVGVGHGHRHVGLTEITAPASCSRCACQRRVRAMLSRIVLGKCPRWWGEPGHVEEDSFTVIGRPRSGPQDLATRQRRIGGNGALQRTLGVQHDHRIQRRVQPR